MSNYDKPEKARPEEEGQAQISDCSYALGTKAVQKLQLPPPSQQAVLDVNEISAPSFLYTEILPKAGLSISGSNGPKHSLASNTDLGIAEYASALANSSLDRIPDGRSVIDPDSVLDESGRLYHGYKDGAYLLPNDAVCGTSQVGARAY